MPHPAICRFLHQGQVRYGVLNPVQCSVQLIDGWSDSNSLQQDWSEPPCSEVRIDRPPELLPPVPPPEKILCIGLNYRDHAIETNSPIPSEPVVFSKFNTTLIGDGENIVLPRIAEQVDFEAELVVVIGRAGRNISRDEAMNHVLGYTAGHDVSARDWQKGRPGGQWLLGKSFDTFAPLGPAVLATRHFGDPSGAGIQMRINGEVMQDSCTSQLIFDVAFLIEHLSSVMTLNAGDLIFTGTPAGVGAAREPKRFLAAGDVCEVEIEHLPTLANRCIDDSENV